MALVRSSRGHRRRMLAEINVVPYVDVMLVLVVILMVAAPFVNPSLVELPSVGRAAQAPEQPIEVIVRADGKLSVRAKGSDQSVSLPQLVATVRARQGANADVPVVIAADKEVRYEMVVKVMDALQKEGVKRVGLAVKLAN
ncbi:MAG TPA: ExbD/TolR family protein [Burkholderiaceae bacterium]|jgi:biopolymer transport protein TolR|nr:ExbD/TolR family protein [Burkholderiaceae bacterium]HPE00364.1 ExbD/TolR family protein [Burkholderiaceae bacterium]HRY99967.1 ExbD/TolR family protein [Burkholderiaceae bacterium]